MAIIRPSILFWEREMDIYLQNVGHDTLNEYS